MDDNQSLVHQSRGVPDLLSRRGSDWRARPLQLVETAEEELTRAGLELGALLVLLTPIDSEAIEEERPASAAMFDTSDYFPNKTRLLAHTGSQ